jgi:hypothetical protein
MTKSLACLNQIPSQFPTLYSVINSNLLSPFAKEVLEGLNKELTNMNLLGHRINDQIQDITKSLPPEINVLIRDFLREKTLNALRSVEKSFPQI